MPLCLLREHLYVSFGHASPCRPVGDVEQATYVLASQMWHRFDKHGSPLYEEFDAPVDVHLLTAGEAVNSASNGPMQWHLRMPTAARATVALAPAAARDTNNGGPAAAAIGPAAAATAAATPVPVAAKFGDRASYTSETSNLILGPGNPISDILAQLRAMVHNVMDQVVPKARELAAREAAVGGQQGPARGQQEGQFSWVQRGQRLFRGGIDGKGQKAVRSTHSIA